jgi:signal transduction histidine kinase
MKRHHQRRHHRHGKRLFWRIYANGLLQILALALAFGAAFALVGKNTTWSDFGTRVTSYVAADILERKDDPQAMNAKVQELEKLLEARIAIYDREGRMLGGLEGAPPPLSPHQAKRLEKPKHFGQGLLAAPLDGKAGIYAVVKPPQNLKGGPGFFTYLALGLLVLAAVAWPLARTIVRPLEKLTTNARALGQGDLSQRSGIDRKDEVGELARTFDEMADRLQRLIATEKALLANVSHELRTPIARLRVALELCSETDDLPTLKKHLLGVGDDLAELEDLVGQVLDSARLDKGGVESLRLEDKSLSDLFDACTTRFSQRHPTRTVEVVLAKDEILNVDDVMMRRVLDNLLDNAARYAPEGSITLEGEAKGTDQIRIAVSDQGPGIPQDQRERVFEPFVRLEESRSKSSGGVGLGLSLCKRVVEAHGGSLSAGAAPSGGARFEIVLPRPI